jgi:hypothetical protein
MSPNGLSDLSTTTTQPISFFFISLVAASTVSVSLTVTTGLDMTSSILTSGVADLVANLYPNFSVFPTP